MRRFILTALAGSVIGVALAAAAIACLSSPPARAHPPIPWCERRTPEPAVRHPDPGQQFS